MKKILVVEDDKEINNLLKDYLTEQGYSVFSAFQGLEAISIIRENKDFSMIILDLMLPFQSGDKVLSKLREFSDVPVIVVSAKDTVQTKIDIIRMGADDYITKPFDLRELLVRVKSLIRRLPQSTEPSAENIIEVKSLKVMLRQRKVLLNNTILDLTPKEFDLLALLMNNLDIVFTREQLLDKVWGMDYVGGTRTVDIHIQRLRKKLGTSFEDMLQTIYGIGYKACGDIYED